MRFRIISVALLSALVSGCVGIPHSRVEGDRLFVCIDHVEYFEATTTPHLMPDGRPYACNY